MNLTNHQYFRSTVAKVPGTSHTIGTMQSTFNPSRFHSVPKRRLQLPIKSVLKNTSKIGYTHPHAYKLFPTRLKKKENAIEVAAYPITQEKEFDVYYPTANEKGQVEVSTGIQNIGRRSKEDITMSEYPLVPKEAPRLNLSKVNFQKDFFRKDYRVNGETHDNPYYQGYDKRK